MSLSHQSSEICRLLGLSKVFDNRGARAVENSPASQKTKEAPKSH